MEVSHFDHARLTNTLTLIKSLAPEAQILKEPETMQALLGVAYVGGDPAPKALYDANLLLQDGLYSAADFSNSPVALAVVNNQSLESLARVVFDNPKAASQVVDEMASTQQGEALLPILMLTKSLLLAIEDQGSLSTAAMIIARLISKRAAVETDLASATEEEQMASSGGDSTQELASSL